MKIQKILDKDSSNIDEKAFIRINYKGKIFYLSYVDYSAINGFSYIYYGHKLISINKKLTDIQKSKLLHKLIGGGKSCGGTNNFRY